MRSPHATIVPVLALGLAALAVACGGAQTGLPSTQSTRISIAGADPIQLPQAGSVTRDYRAVVTGPATELNWTVSRADYVSVPEVLQTFSERDEIQWTYAEMGTYIIRVEARNAAGELKAVDVDTVGVLPFMPPYDRPLAFYSYDTTDRTSGLSRIYSLRPEARAATRFVTEGTFNGNHMSWGPDGERLAVTVREGSQRRSNIHVLDAGSGEMLSQVSGTDGISWMPDWNPVRDVIAYVDDSRFALNDSDELALAQADGSGVQYVSGDAPSYEFTGFYPSWSPDGEKLALGNSPFETAGGEHIRRIAIYENLTDLQNFTKRPLHSEEVLEQELGLAGRDVSEGDNGVAWSPEGERIAYTAFIGFGTLSRIAVANADGSGAITVFPYEPAYGVTWSPDGSYIVFGIGIGQAGRKHLLMTDANGENPVDLSRLRGADPDELDDFTPEWF